MPLIEIQRVCGMPREKVFIKEGSSFFDFISNANVSHDVRININGDFIDDDESLDFEINKNDIIKIFDQPRGGGLIGTLLNPLEHLNPIKFTQKIFASLTKNPSSSFASVAQKTSPNNSIKSQENTARNGEARPDIYGQIIAYPDLIQQSLVEYSDNLKFITEYMNIGIGTYSVSQVRFSESSISSMAGAAYSVFQPNSEIPQIIQPYSFDDIDGQEIPGRNETSSVVIESATSNNIDMSAYEGGQLQIRIKKENDFDYFAQISTPHSISFIVNVTYQTPSGNVTTNLSLFGNLISVTEYNIDNDDFYTFTIESINGDNSGALFNGTINDSLFTITDNQPLIMGPFFSPIELEQLWINTESALSGEASTNWKVTIWKINPDNSIVSGTTEIFNYSQGNPDTGVSQSMYRTDKITPSSGIGRYAVSIERTDNSSGSSRLNVESISCISVRYNVYYPSDTIIRITMQATKNPSTSRGRKFNALVTRHVISYNKNSGQIIRTTSPSRSFADAVLHTWVEMAGQPSSMLDIEKLYDISLGLEDPRLGYFDYSFDDEDVSLGERIQTICDAARVVAYWDDGVLSFVRDEKILKPSTIFNASNTKAGQYSISYDMTLPDGNDGVRLQYKNPRTNKQDYVYYKIDGNEVVSGQPLKPKKIDMLYVRNLYQATDRAIVECKKLMYSRISMNINTLSDGEWINVGDMIQVVDIYDKNQQGGKITSRNGNVFTTSEQIDFIDDMYVVLTDSIGNPTDKYRAYPVDGKLNAFNAEIPESINISIWDGVNVQSPSRYIIATQSEMGKTLWTVTAKQPSQNGSVGLTVAEYHDEMYEYDNPVT